jgi:hypothetical protein
MAQASVMLFAELAKQLFGLSQIDSKKWIQTILTRQNDVQTSAINEVAKMQIENLTPSTANELTSIGRLSCQLGCLPHRLRQLGTQFDVKPSVVIDGVQYFGRSQAEFLQTKLSELGIKK